MTNDRLDSPSSNSSLTDRLGESQRTGFVFEQETGFEVTGYEYDDDIRQGKNLTNSIIVL